MKLANIDQVRVLADKLLTLRKIYTAKETTIVKVTVNNHDSEVVRGNARECEDFYIKPSRVVWEAMLKAEIQDLESKLRTLGVDV